jgi:hypothetical protein
MTRTVDRRVLCVGLGLIAASVAGRAAAADDGPLEGTWGGDLKGLTAQVIITGGSVIGFYWRGDYRDAADVKFAAGGRSVAFSFEGGAATITRTGDSTATIAVHEGAKVTQIDLKRDGGS